MSSVVLFEDPGLVRVLDVLHDWDWVGCWHMDLVWHWDDTVNWNSDVLRHLDGVWLWDVDRHWTVDWDGYWNLQNHIDLLYVNANFFLSMVNC